MSQWDREKSSVHGTERRKVAIETSTGFDHSHSNAIDEFCYLTYSSFMNLFNPHDVIPEATRSLRLPSTHCFLTTLEQEASMSSFHQWLNL